MFFPSEQQVTFAPLLIVDWSMEHSHRRTVVEDASASSSEPAKPGAPRHRLVGFFLAKALSPLRVIGAR